jgi:uncharacterized protein
MRPGCRSARCTNAKSCQLPLLSATTENVSDIRAGTIRLCLDANRIISGVARPDSASGRLLAAVVEGTITLVASTEIWLEYQAKAADPKVQKLFVRKGVAPDRYLLLLAQLNDLIEFVELVGEAPYCRDEKDRVYLHCAVTAGVDALITRDKDLLILQSIEGIPIVDTHAWRR